MDDEETMVAVARKPPPVDLPPDGVLVRRPTSDEWVRELPAAPETTAVTVSLTDPAAAIRHAAELADRGYHPVGSAGESGEEGTWADFLVPRALVDGDRAWLRALVGPHGRIFEPALGPVRLALGPVLAAHRRRATDPPP